MYAVSCTSIVSEIIFDFALLHHSVEYHCNCYVAVARSRQSNIPPPMMDLCFDTQSVTTPTKKRIIGEEPTPLKLDKPSSGPLKRTAEQSGTWSHPRGCGDENCLECWVRGQSFIASVTSLRNTGLEDVLGRSWLKVRIIGGKFKGIGCSVCRLFIRHRTENKLSTIGAKLPNSFGSCNIRSTAALKVSRFRQHGNSNWHVSAIEWARGHESGMLSCLQKHSPSQYQFETLFNHLKAGNSRSHIPDIGGAIKLSRMTWCLAETIRKSQRNFLKDAETIGIYQDKKDGSLSTRFSACNANLTCIGGYMGTLRSHGGHLAIIESTETMTKTFCTPDYGAHRAAKKSMGRIEMSPNSTQSCSTSSDIKLNSKQLMLLQT